MGKEEGAEQDEQANLLNAALKKYKDIRKCKMCETRDKNVLLVKCGHLFCRDCIMRNFQLRERHCPICRRIFTAEDIKAVWLDT